MSIDHGKLLARLREIANGLADQQAMPDDTWERQWDEALATAQPAEAVEGGNIERLVRLDEDGGFSVDPAILDTPGYRRQIEGARILAGLEHDAAQGAVATVCLVGERYAHGHMVSVELQLAGEDAPAPKIGDLYYTHPQAAPAQGSGMVLVGYVYNNRCVATDESRKEGCLQGEFAQSLPNGTQLFAAAPAEAVNPDLCPACKTWPVDDDSCPNCGREKPFTPAEAAHSQPVDYSPALHSVLSYIAYGECDEEGLHPGLFATVKEKIDKLRSKPVVDEAMVRAGVIAAAKVDANVGAETVRRILTAALTGDTP